MGQETIMNVKHDNEPLNLVNGLRQTEIAAATMATSYGNYGNGSYQDQMVMANECKESEHTLTEVKRAADQNWERR